MKKSLNVRFLSKAAPRKFRCDNALRKPQIVSAIQPSGTPHLGNYLGALKNWHTLSIKHDCCIFGIADNHVFTSKTAAGEVRSNTIAQAAVLLAMGIDPETSILYKHSSVVEHTALAWLLSTAATSGLMTRLSSMPQYREKSRIHDNLALLSYPVLMSADILLFHGTHIPVGEDQNIHLEFCNQLGQYFNTLHRTKIFHPVEKILTPSPRIKSLADPSVKMSKSYGKAIGCIGLLDPDVTIRKKVRKAVTDSLGALSREYKEGSRPGVDNLVYLMALLRSQSREEVLVEYEGENVGRLKDALAEELIGVIAPLREESNRLMKDAGYVCGVLDEGAQRARSIAQPNLREVYEIMGLK